MPRRLFQRTGGIGLGSGRGAAMPRGGRGGKGRRPARSLRCRRPPPRPARWLAREASPPSSPAAAQRREDRRQPAHSHPPPPVGLAELAAPAGPSRRKACLTLLLSPLVQGRGCRKPTHPGTARSVCLQGPGRRKLSPARGRLRRGSWGEGRKEVFLSSGLPSQPFDLVR